MTELLDEIAQEEAPPPIGHNQPPEPTLIERAAGRVANANRWLTERPEILDEDIAGKAQGFWDQLRGDRDDLEKAEKAEKKPLQDQIAAITKRYQQPRAAVVLAYELIGKVRQAWLLKKQAKIDEGNRQREAEVRRKQDEADRLAHEAAEAAKAKPGADVIGTMIAAETAQREAAEAAKAAAKAPTRATDRGDFSARASGLRTLWDARIKPTPEGDSKARAAVEKEILTFFAKDPEGRGAMVESCLVIAKKRAKAAKRADVAAPGFEYFSRQVV
jgi:hypothetical protein